MVGNTFVLRYEVSRWALFSVLCILCDPCCPGRIHAYTCSSHSDSIHPPCCRNSTFSLKSNIHSKVGSLFSLTVTPSMAMALAVNVSVFTLAVVTLTV